MAQIYKVRVPARALGLGAVELAPREGLALATLAGGLASAFGVYLFATGRRQEAYALAIASGITTAFLAAARLLGAEERSASSPALSGARAFAGRS